MGKIVSFASWSIVFGIAAWFAGPYVIDVHEARKNSGGSAFMLPHPRNDPYVSHPSGSADETHWTSSSYFGRFDNWALLKNLTGHSKEVRGIAWSPDSTRIASTSDDSTARIWDSSSGQCLRELTGDPKGVNAVTWSPDGQLLATVSEDDYMHIWSGLSFECIRSQRIPQGQLDLAGSISHGPSFPDVSWSPDGQYLAVSVAEYVPVVIYRATSGRQLKDAVGVSGRFAAVAWSPDSRYLASTTKDFEVNVWGMRSHRMFCKLSGHKDDVTTIAWSPDGDRLATSSMDHSVRVWDSKTGDLQLTISAKLPNGYRPSVRSVAWSPDGHFLVSGNYDYTVCIWDADTGSLLKCFTDPTSYAWSVAWSPDGSKIACGSLDHSVRIWGAQ